MTAVEWDTDSPAAYPEPRSTIYLTGVSTEITRASDNDGLGLLVTPASGVWRQIEHYRYYGADNGLYNENHPVHGFDFDEDAWLTWVDGLPRDGCLFVTLPDVLNWHVDEAGKPYCIGDYEATLARSAQYADQVRAMGFPVAIVAQDGLTSLDQIPFEVDAVFIGGSDAYKLGADAAQLVAEVKARGMWTHMGRVNSMKRMRIAQGFGCDSADGTFLKFGNREQRLAAHDILLGWIDTLAAEYAA